MVFAEKIYIFDKKYNNGESDKTSRSDAYFDDADHIYISRSLGFMRFLENKSSCDEP